MTNTLPRLACNDLLGFAVDRNELRAPTSRFAKKRHVRRRLRKHSRPGTNAGVKIRRVGPRDRVNKITFTETKTITTIVCACSNHERSWERTFPYGVDPKRHQDDGSSTLDL